MLRAFYRGLLWGSLLSLGFWAGLFAAPLSYEFNTRRQRR